nr:hypothetical protein [Tanacetum cinerariifolium]
HQDHSPFNQNYMQQPMPNPKDITDPTTTMNISLMAKAFKLNYSTPRNRQIAQPVQNVGNQGAQNPRVQNVGNHNGLIGVQGNGNQNQIGNDNIMAVRAEGNAAGHNGNQIRCYNCRGLGHFARDYTQASSSGTQTNSTPVYDSDGSDEVHEYENCYNNEIFNMFTQEEQYTELLEPIPEPQQLKETNADLTTELARYENKKRCFEISQEKYDKLERCYQKSV